MRKFVAWLIARAIKYSGVPLRDPALAAWFGGTATDAGIDVTETRALNCSAVFAARRLIAESVASLPVILYRRVADGKQRESNHAAYTLLHDTPNPEMTAFTFHERFQGDALFRGAGVAEIERNGAGQPLALWPIPCDRVSPRRTAAGRLYYEINVSRDGISRETRNLLPENVLYVSGAGDILTLARESIGLTLATEKHGAKYFGNGTRPGGALKAAGALTEPARKNLKESLEAAHMGLEQSHRLMLLEEGLDYVPMGNTAEEAQFLETRKFQTVEIARWFNVPPHMLRDLERATFSNIEHQGIDFVTYSLRPWLIRREQEFNRKLLSTDERKVLFFEHLVDALLRGDIKSRYDAYAVALANGFASPNDVQRAENRNPIDVPEANQYRRQVNQVPMGAGINSPNDLAAIAAEVKAGTLDATQADAILAAAYPALTPEQRKAIVTTEVAPAAPVVDEEEDDEDGAESSK